MNKIYNIVDVGFTYLRKNLRSRVNFAFKKEKITKFYASHYLIPETLYIECTNICNAKCVFCYYPKVEASLPRKHMGIALFKKIVLNYTDIGGKKIALTPTIGDPLVDRYFSERIKILNESEIETVHLYTNLIKVNHHIQEALLSVSNFEFKINVSIAGFDRQAYGNLMGVDRFDKVKKNLQILKNISKINSKIKLSVRLQEYYGSEDSRKPFMQYLSDLGIPVSINTLVDTWGGLVEEDIDNAAVFEKRPRLKRRGPCQISYTKPVVNVDGKLKLCDCRDVNNELTIGDLDQERLEVIWQSDKVTQIRNSMYDINKMPEICKKCEMYISIFDRGL